MNRLNKILIIVIIFLLVVIGIRFINYKNIKYQEKNKESVVIEETESKAKDETSEKEPIQSPKQEEYEGDKQYGDSIMIF